MYEWYSNDYIKAMKERPLDEHEIYGLSTGFNLGKARRYAIEHNHIKYRDKFYLAFNLLFQSEYKTMEMLYAGGFPVTQSILMDAIDFRNAKAVEILLKYMKHPVTETRIKQAQDNVAKYRNILSLITCYVPCKNPPPRPKYEAQTLSTGYEDLHMLNKRDLFSVLKKCATLTCWDIYDIMNGKVRDKGAVLDYIVRHGIYATDKRNLSEFIDNLILDDYPNVLDVLLSRGHRVTSRYVNDAIHYGNWESLSVLLKYYTGKIPISAMKHANKEYNKRMAVLNLLLGGK